MPSNEAAIEEGEIDNGEGPPLERVVIDNEGDVLLKTSTKEFLASSKVLGMASSYFSTMFKSNFVEGRAERSPDKPLLLDASEDDTEAMNVLLHAIHFAYTPGLVDPNIDLQFKISILSDKYECLRALHAHSQRWLAHTTYDNSLWQMTTIAYLMHHPDKFVAALSQIAQRSTEAFLRAIELPVQNLPDAIKGVLLFSRKKTIDAMMLEIEKCMSELYKNPLRFTMASTKICERCGREKPRATKMCGSCGSADFLDHYCDPGVRLAFFVKCLETGNAWPLSGQRENSPASLLHMMSQYAPKHHGCSKASKCPAVTTSQVLIAKLKEVIDEESKIDFKPARFDRDFWTNANAAGENRKVEEAYESDASA